MPDITVALALLKKPIEAVGAIASGRAKEIIARIRASASLKTLYQKLNATQKVKTIWNVDRPIALSSFYYPAKIRTKSNIVQPLLRLDDLPSNAVVLSGIVGQGKSILLRYLLGKEIRCGERVPIFVELRRVPATGVEFFVRQAFADLLDVTGAPEVFELFASTGKISLLLDGFDEVDPDHTSEVATSIESLASRFPTMRIVVTSRPNSGIESSPHFDVVPIAQLAEQDFSGFFHKILPKDKALADRITQAVMGSPLQVRELASTPLLATLLTIVYRAHQRIPNDFAEFYDELFQILLVRHDRSKSGYERKRKTKLSDRDIQQAFEAFCFKCKAEKLSSVPRPKGLELAAASIATLNLNADEGHFLADIVKVTCLLQEEGGRLEFLHQSVQEFFSARYVSSRPDEIARSFYSLVLSRSQWQSWDQVLRFLAQIDRYRSSLYFFVPALDQTIRHLESQHRVASSPRLRNLISDIAGVTQSLSKSDGTPEQTPRYTIYLPNMQKRFRLDQVYTKLFSSFFGPRGGASGKWRQCFDGTTEGQKISYTQLAIRCGIEPLLDSTLESAIALLRGELADHQARVKLFNESKDFMGL